MVMKVEPFDTKRGGGGGREIALFDKFIVEKSHVCSSSYQIYDTANAQFGMLKRTFVK